MPVWDQSNLSEALTAAFHDWEVRGRGWLVFDEPVTLEPSFRPFIRRLPIDRSSVGDDGLTFRH